MKRGGEVLSRQQIKRFLALLKAQVEYSNRDIVVDVPLGFKESFENQTAFRGWVNYHITWDIDKSDVWLVIHRKISLVAEWHRELIRVVPVISPVNGEIMEA